MTLLMGIATAPGCAPAATDATEDNGRPPLGEASKAAEVIEYDYLRSTYSKLELTNRGHALEMGWDDEHPIVHRVANLGSKRLNPEPVTIPQGYWIDWLPNPPVRTASLLFSFALTRDGEGPKMIEDDAVAMICDGRPRTADYSATFAYSVIASGPMDVKVTYRLDYLCHLESNRAVHADACELFNVLDVPVGSFSFDRSEGS